MSHRFPVASSVALLLLLAVLSLSACGAALAVTASGVGLVNQVNQIEHDAALLLAVERVLHDRLADADRPGGCGGAKPGHDLGVASADADGVGDGVDRLH